MEAEAVIGGVYYTGYLLWIMNIMWGNNGNLLHMIFWRFT